MFLEEEILPRLASLGVRPAYLRDQPLQLLSLLPHLLLFVGTDFFQFVEASPLPVLVRIHDFRHVGVDNGVQENYRIRGIIGAKADLHDLGLGGKADLQPVVEPSLQIAGCFSALDPRKLGNLRILQRRRNTKRLLRSSACVFL